MKIPEKAPDWISIMKSNVNAMFETDALKTANKIDQQDDYLYWDKIKYCKMPEDVSPELMWCSLKFSRKSKIIKIGLISKNKKKFGYWTPDSFLRDFSFIDKYASGQILVSDSGIHESEQKKYVINSLMEEAIASSQLEGAATTRKVAKEMLRSGRKPKNDAEQMIFNNYKTILQVRDLVNEPLTEKLILKLHHLMTIDTLEDPSSCGRFRVKEDDPICVRDTDGQILYEPPDPKDIYPMIKILCGYANKAEHERFTHTVVKAITLHFYLAYIHPFVDGNGRTARALFYWYMLKQEYWMFEYLTISRMFIKAPAQYARAFLYTEIDDLDLTYFISFHLKVIRMSMKALLSYIKRKQKELKQAIRYLKNYPELNDRQIEVVKQALDDADSYFTFRTHQTIYNIVYETARKDLFYLVKKQLLTKIKKGREFYFVPSVNLRRKIRA